MLPDIEESTYINEDSVITSLDKIKFENVKRKYVCDPANPTFITAEYVMVKEIRPSTRDWLGLFPRGWNSLNTFVAFEYIVGRAYNEQERKWKVSVSLKFVKEDLYHPEFQFVFVSSDLQVMGTSSFFRFYKCEADAEKAFKLNVRNIKSEIQLFEKMQVSEAETTSVVQRSNKFARVAEEDGYQEKYRYNPSPVRACISDTILLQNRNGVYMPNCRNCERLPEILNLQHNLFYELKNMAESKRDLEDHIKKLEEKLELSMAAQKKLRVIAEYEKRERITFQTIATTVLQQISDDSVLRVTNGNLEPIYSQIFNTCITAMAHAHRMFSLSNNQAMPGMWPTFADVQVVLQPIHSPPNQYPTYNQYQRRSRSSVSTSILSRHLELKAIIGAQNEKLRIMSSKLAQMKVVDGVKTEPTKEMTTVWKAETSRESPLYRSSAVTLIK